MDERIRELQQLVAGLQIEVMDLREGLKLLRADHNFMVEIYDTWIKQLSEQTGVRLHVVKARSEQ